MGKIPSLLVLTALLALGTAPVVAQAPAKAPGYADELLRSWNEVGNKLIEMAEDFPEEKYDYRPTPEVRTFAEQLLHVAGSTYFFRDLAEGKEPGEENLSREEYKTKADIVAALKKSVAAGADYIRQIGDAGLSKPVKYPWSEQPTNQAGVWTTALEHAGEHYGNLVVYYRLNGLIPPASRPRNP